VKFATRLLFYSLLVCTLPFHFRISHGQTFEKYGFKASFPCELKEELELGKSFVDPTGEFGLSNWVAFQCLQQKGIERGVLYRVISSTSEPEMRNYKLYAKVICKKYSQEGWDTEISEYKGRPACLSRTTQTIRGRDFKQWSLDFVSGEHGFMISVVSNTNNIEEEMSTLKSNFELVNY
jgi:hypothetical protein